MKCSVVVPSTIYTVTYAESRDRLECTTAVPCPPVLNHTLSINCWRCVFVIDVCLMVDGGVDCHRQAPRPLPLPQTLNHPFSRSIENKLLRPRIFCLETFD